MLGVEGGGGGGGVESLLNLPVVVSAAHTELVTRNTDIQVKKPTCFCQLGKGCVCKTWGVDGVRWGGVVQSNYL